MTIIRENLARNSFGRGPGSQYSNVGGRENRVAYLFVFIALNYADEAPVSIPWQLFWSISKDLLYIGRRSGFSREWLKPGSRINPLLL